MNIKALTCPNCGGPYNPAKRNCEYCGSYIIFTNLNEENYSVETFLSAEKPDTYKGIYIYGILLDKDEYPVRMGGANYRKSMLNAVGGHLLLTNKRLAFISHSINFGGEMALYLPMNSLKRAEPGANLGISAVYSVYDNSNKKYTFVIYGRNEWVEKTNRAIAGEYEPLESFASVTSTPKTESAGYMQELVKLKELLDAGIITQEDYDIKKRILLKI